MKDQCMGSQSGAPLDNVNVDSAYHYVIEVSTAFLPDWPSGDRELTFDACRAHFEEALKASLDGKCYRFASAEGRDRFVTLGDGLCVGSFEDFVRSKFNEADGIPQIAGNEMVRYAATPDHMAVKLAHAAVLDDELGWVELDGGEVASEEAAACHAKATT